MAYPTPPAPRIPYDLDGTVGIAGPGPITGNQPVTLSQAGLTVMNGNTGPSVVVVHWETGNPTGSYGNAGFGYYDVNGKDAVPLTNVDPLPWLAMIFPRPMQLSAFYGHITPRAEQMFISPSAAEGSFQPFLLQTSTDTTNGTDGTWKTVLDVSTPMAPSGQYAQTVADVLDGTSPTPVPVSGYSGPDVNTTYRQSGDGGGYGWRTLSGAWLRNVIGVRFLIDRTPAAFPFSYNGWNFTGMKVKAHLYGQPEPAFDPNRVTLVSTDGSPKTFDFGNVRQGTTLTTSFAVKNTSASLTAHAVTVSIGAPSPAPATVLPAQISLDGGVTWTNTLSLPDLAPGAVSAPIQVKVQPPAINLLGNWAPRLSVNAGSWS